MFQTADFCRLYKAIAYGHLKLLRPLINGRNLQSLFAKITNDSY